MNSVEIYFEGLTRVRHLELEKVKRENAVMRAQIALAKFYRIYNAKYCVKNGTIIVS